MRAVLFIAFFSTLLVCTLLGGCGQKGPLFIPSDNPPPKSGFTPQQSAPMQPLQVN